jgi:hypothetical protein
MEPTVEPRARARELEQRAGLPEPPGERFAGWGVFGLPFASGHVLALRRFPASSVGPDYTSIWHRAPDGAWTMYVNVSPRCSCPRYFGEAVTRVVETEVVVSWTGPRQFSVVTGTAGFHWAVKATSTPATRLLTAVARRLPDAWWRSDRALDVLGRLAGPLLGAGTLRLRGRAPNGHRFLAAPRRVWAVEESAAVVDGVRLGPPGPLGRQARLGDFRIPQRGLVAAGDSVFDDDPSAVRAPAGRGPGSAATGTRD